MLPSRLWCRETRRASLTSLSKFQTSNLLKPPLKSISRTGCRCALRRERRWSAATRLRELRRVLESRDASWSAATRRGVRVPLRRDALRCSRRGARSAAMRFRAPRRGSERRGARSSVRWDGGANGQAPPPICPAIPVRRPWPCTFSAHHPRRHAWGRLRRRGLGAGAVEVTDDARCLKE